MSKAPGPPFWQLSLPQIVFLAAVVAACSPTPQPQPPTPTPTVHILPSATPSTTATTIPTATLSPSPTSVPLTEICSPLADHDLSRILEYVSHPFALPIGSNLETGHHGLDFSYYTRDGVGPPIDGNPVQAVMVGRIAGIGLNRLPYGNMLVIETPFERFPAAISSRYEMQPGSSLYLLYAHMLAAPINAIGDWIECGQLLGHVGNSGFSGNPHLHLETRLGPSGLELPTMIYYDTTATLDQQAAYQAWRTGESFTLFDPTLLLTSIGANENE